MSDELCERIAVEIETMRFPAEFSSDHYAMWQAGFLDARTEAARIARLARPGVDPCCYPECDCPGGKVCGL
jgi:hypothetical protein